MSTDRRHLPPVPGPAPWQVLAGARERTTENAPIWTWGDPAADQEGELEARFHPWAEPDGSDGPDAPEARVQVEEHDQPAEPRTADAATWVARGIVVLTIGLLAVVGGLFLGMSVADTSATATSTPTPSETSSTLSETSTPEAVIETRAQAPAVRISPAGPDAAARTSGAATPTAAVASQARATAVSSPTSTATPRGKSTNSGKPRPTKTN